MSPVERAKQERGELQEMERLVADLAREQSPKRLEVIHDIFRAAVKLAQESTGTLNLKIAAATLKELRFSFKVFYPHRLSPKITVFGSARSVPGDSIYELTKQFAKVAAQKKYMIITGGGPGVMAAGNEGVGAEGGFGLNIRLPFEQLPNPFINPKNRLIHYKYFFTRKLFLIKEAAAFVLFPGGFGTFDEAFELLTLLQTGKTNLIPMVLLEPEGFGFWQAFEKWVDKEMIQRNFISPSDLNFFKVFYQPQQAMEHIERFYRNYHSMRFVKDLLVIRLRKKMSDATLTPLIRKFDFIAPKADFHFSAPLPIESNEPELKDLNRLVFTFERKDFGGLRSLIDYLNEYNE